MPWPPPWPASVPVDWLPLAAGAYPRRHPRRGADTGLWTAIFRDNRGPMLKALDSLRDRLATFQYALMTDDEDAIRRWWDEARLRRAVFDELSVAANPARSSDGRARSRAVPVTLRLPVPMPDRVRRQHPRSPRPGRPIRVLHPLMTRGS